MKLKFLDLIRKNFKIKLVLSIILLILVIFSFYLIFSLYHSIKILKEGLIKTGLVLTEDLGYASEFGILAGDPTFVGTSILGIFEKKDVLFVIIYDKGGKIIAVQKKVDIDQQLPKETINEILDKQTVLWKEKYIEKEKLLDFYSPIIGRMGLTPPGDVIGFARLGLSQTEIIKEKNRILLLYSVITLGFIFFGGVISFYLTQKSTQPLNELMKGVKALKEGKFSYRIRVKTKDEFGSLAEAFNRMVEELERSRAVLEEAKATLEIKVAARTEELRELAKGLERRVKERTRELEEEKNKTLAVITNFTDGLLVFDRENKLLLINPRAEVFLDVKGKDIIGKSTSELSKIVILKPLIKFYTQKTKKVFRKELKIKENLILEVTTTSLMSGQERLGTLVILHDVTREKLIEKMKTEFVSLTAHQLRTPLSAIKWILRMLLDGELGKINREQREFLTDGYKSNERMISLISDLLNVARIEEGRYIYKLTLADIGEITQSVINSHREELAKKRLRLEFNRPAKKVPETIIDVEKVKIAIDNIVDNAIRYSLAGGKVTVSLKYGKKEIELSVKDTGMGIPKLQQKRVFTKFFRGANAVRKETEGTGLGLFITKNIIEAYGGRIWFESKEGAGTTFYFTIPINPVRD